MVSFLRRLSSRFNPRSAIFFGELYHLDLIWKRKFCSSFSWRFLSCRYCLQGWLVENAAGSVWFPDCCTDLQLCLWIIACTVPNGYCGSTSTSAVLKPYFFWRAVSADIVSFASSSIHRLLRTGGYNARRPFDQASHRKKSIDLLQFNCFITAPVIQVESMCWCFVTIILTIIVCSLRAPTHPRAILRRQLSPGVLSLVSNIGKCLKVPLLSRIGQPIDHRKSFKSLIISLYRIVHEEMVPLNVLVKIPMKSYVLFFQNYE